VFGDTEHGPGQRAYDDLWGPPSIGGAPGDLSGEIARWEAGCASSPLWDELRLASRADRHEGRLRRLDGREWLLRTTPLTRGTTLATFQAPGEARARGAADATPPPPPAEPFGPHGGAQGPSQAVPGHPVPAESL
jgi:hypothetical protein